MITTVSTVLRGTFRSVPLGGLAANDAEALLCRGYSPADREQHRAATAICERLGNLALAVDVTRARIRSSTDFVDQHRRLSERTMEMLERAAATIAATGERLAGNHSPSVTATVQESVELLSDDALATLGVAAAFEPVPLVDAVLTDIAAHLNPVTGATWLDYDESVRAALEEIAALSLARCDEGRTLLHRLVVDHVREMFDVAPAIAAATEGLRQRFGDVADIGRRHHNQPFYEMAVGLASRPRAQLADDLVMHELAIGDVFGAVRRSEALSNERRALLGAEHPLTLLADNNLGFACHRAGDVESAVAVLGYTLELRERVLGEDDPQTLVTRSNLATASADRDGGLRAAAIAELRAVLAAREQTLGPKDEKTILSRSKLAGQLQAAGEFVEAKALFEQVVTERTSLLGAGHPTTLVARHNLATVLRDLGDLPLAIDIHRAVAEAADQAIGAEHEHTLSFRLALAVELWEFGQHDEARDQVRRAVELADRHLPPGHPLIDILRQHSEAMA